MEGGSGVVLVLRPDGVVEFASRRFQELTGFELSSIVGQRWLEIFVPFNSRAAAALALADGFDGASPRGLVHPILCRDGREVLINWLGSQVCASAGQVRLLVVTGVAVAELTPAGDLTGRNEMLMSSFLTGATDAIIVTDAEGTIQIFSAGAEEVFRCGRDNVVGRSINQLIPAQFRADHGERVSEFVHSDRTNLWMKARSEIRGLRMTGEEFAASATVTKIVANGENLLLVILRDLSEQKIQELALQNAKLRAEASNRAKSAFLATMSHEIRTPMNGVLGMLSVLEETRLDELQREMVEISAHAGRMLMTILDDILDYSRIEAGRVSVELTNLSVRDVLKRTAALHARAASKAGVALNVEVDPAIPEHLIGDPLRIQQVLHNLVGNAAKFTPKGRIDVRARYKSGAGSTDILELEVEDTGIGMTEDELEIVFDRFTQANSSSTRNYGGSGLGLSIAKGLAEAMGGTVDAVSRPGLGSRFSVHLPILRHGGEIVSPDDDKSERVNPGSAMPPLSLRVLVAEDHPVNARMLQLLLGRKGILATMADNGAKAVELFEPGEFDLVIMDIQMPVLDGESALKAIRQLDQGFAVSPTYTVACTAAVEPAQVDRYRRMGFDDVLAKPIAIDALDQILATAAKQCAARHD